MIVKFQSRRVDILINILIILTSFDFNTCQIINSTAANTKQNSTILINQNITSLNITILPPVIISKTLIKVINDCQANPMLNFLPNLIRTSISDSLNSLPILSTNSYCKNNNALSCCTSSTFDLYQPEILNTIAIKQTINYNNLNIYYRIINEHSRNFQTYFQFSQSQFDLLFSDYKYYINNITLISQNLVKESVYFKWNSFCNFICYPSSNTICDTYNVTYSYNNSLYYDLNYDCDLLSEDRVINIQNLTNSFNLEMNNINDTINGFYSYVNDTIANVIRLNPLTENITLINDTYTLLNNSISDGLYVSTETSGQPKCENYSSLVLADYITNNYSYSYMLNLTCEDILNKICIPFYCFDDLIMGFNDDSKSDVESLINLNYNKIHLIKGKGVSYADLFSQYDFDIKVNVDNSFMFVSSSCMFSHSCYLIFNFIIFIFILL